MEPIYTEIDLLRKFFILCLFSIILSTSFAQAQIGQTTTLNGVTLLTDSARRYEKIELSADITSATEITTPYDPDQIRVDGKFVTPSGAMVTVPGFYYRDYQYDAGSGTLAATANWSWRVRYTPIETGDYRYQVIVTTADGIIQSETGKFSAA